MEERNIITINFEIDVDAEEELLKDLIINRKKKINVGYIKNNKDLMIWSAEKGQEKIIELLIQLGVDVTANKNEAICMAVATGHEKIVKLLLDTGVNIIEEDIISDLDYAVSRGYIEVVRLIVERIQLNAKTMQDLLENATRNGHTEIVRLLLVFKTQITDYSLRYAAEKGYTEIVKLLIVAGADVTVNNNEALRRAIEYGRLEIVELLMKTGLISKFMAEEYTWDYYPYPCMDYRVKEIRENILKIIQTS